MRVQKTVRLYAADVRVAILEYIGRSTGQALAECDASVRFADTNPDGDPIDAAVAATVTWTAEEKPGEGPYRG